MARYGKGQSGNPKGRPKGAKNKTTQTVKALILEVTEGLGGAERLLAWAEKNAGEFFTKMLTRLIPTEVNATVEDLTDPHRLTNAQLAHIAAGGSLDTAPKAESDRNIH